MAGGTIGAAVELSCCGGFGIPAAAASGAGPGSAVSLGCASEGSIEMSVAVALGVSEGSTDGCAVDESEATGAGVPDGDVGDGVAGAEVSATGSPDVGVSETRVGDEVAVVGSKPLFGTLTGALEGSVEEGAADGVDTELAGDDGDVSVVVEADDALVGSKPLPASGAVAPGTGGGDTTGSACVGASPAVSAISSSRAEARMHHAERRVADFALRIPLCACNIPTATCPGVCVEAKSEQGAPVSEAEAKPESQKVYVVSSTYDRGGSLAEQ